MEKLIIYKGKEVVNEITDKVSIYARLAGELIAKKLCECKYIKRIKRVNLYNGYEEITVVYDNECKLVFTIKNH